MDINNVFDQLGLNKECFAISTGSQNFKGSGPQQIISSPVDAKKIGDIQLASSQDLDPVIHQAGKAFAYWRNIPAPRRGEIVRQMGDALREKKEALGTLVSYEMGKSLQEGLGEVQEMIDICDFAVGLSRQLYGLSLHSERPDHRMTEQWHPLGIVGIISAFNFPVAVWSWNSMIAWICGNVSVWKPSEKTPFSAIACQNIIRSVLQKNQVPEGVSCLVCGDLSVGQALAADERVALLSATGSTRMGKSVAQTVAARLGKSLLELGGNNAIIVSKHADLQLAIPAIVFGSVGTAGQRCTSTRRLIIHESIYAELRDKLKNAYRQIRIGSPLDASNHMGPLIDQDAVKMYEEAIARAQKEGANLICGGKIFSGPGFESGCYVEPSILEATPDMEITRTETFAPILYIMKYKELDEAIAIQNNVPQGLSSAIFTLNMREAEYFLSQRGSDCGIANVNIGTSGAEIGGAFGGEKETGGGRESGSDAWKAYMRRQTCTSNWGTGLPLAQGIRFDF